MYEKHKLFVTPPDKTIIWRYMDFTKFVDILEKSQLFFPMANRLGDHFEGSSTRIDVELRYKAVDSVLNKTTIDKIGRDRIPKAMSIYNRIFKSYIAISCWNIGDNESAALWKLYFTGTEGIAIQSTIRSLRKCLEKEKKIIYIGEVKYIDYTNDITNSLSELRMFLYKRKNFEHEHEVRAITSFASIMDNKLKAHTLEAGKMKGYYVTLNPEILIENVFISPSSPKWQIKLVESVMYRYGLNRKVHQSDLLSTKKPIF
jgi:hypothetical protein